MARLMAKIKLSFTLNNVKLKFMLNNVKLKCMLMAKSKLKIYLFKLGSCQKKAKNIYPI